MRDTRGRLVEESSHTPFRGCATAVPRLCHRTVIVITAMTQLPREV